MQHCLFCVLFCGSTIYFILATEFEYFFTSNGLQYMKGGASLDRIHNKRK